MGCPFLWLKRRDTIIRSMKPNHLKAALLHEAANCDLSLRHLVRVKANIQKSGLAHFDHIHPQNPDLKAKALTEAGGLVAYGAALIDQARALRVGHG
jgi:hypothetical protein